MIERLLNPIKARIRLMVGKCLITACGGNVANLSLLAGESREDVDFYQQYGFSSRPKGKVAGVALFIGGSRDNGVVVATRAADKVDFSGVGNGDIGSLMEEASNPSLGAGRSRLFQTSSTKTINNNSRSVFDVNFNNVPKDVTIKRRDYNGLAYGSSMQPAF